MSKNERSVKKNPVRYRKIVRDTRLEMVDRVVRPAGYEMVDTGEKVINRVRDANGNMEDREIPVVEKIWRPVEKETVAVNKVVWEVAEEDGEVHEFATQEDAEDFMQNKEII